MPIRSSSAKNESADTELGEERECRYGARRGTRVPIRSSSAKNESADTELGEERECRYGAQRGTRVSSARSVSADTELGGGGFGKKNRSADTLNF